MLVKSIYTCVDCPYSYHSKDEGSTILRCSKFNNKVTYRESSLCEEVAIKHFQNWETFLILPVNHTKIKKIIKECNELLDKEYDKRLN